MSKSYISSISLAAVLIYISSGAALCTVHINNIFTNNAVLQQKIPIPVWGTASNGETVTVSINGQSASTTASSGKWRVNLPAMNAGGPYTMTIAGPSNTITLTNIDIGEVWVASGQSNMDDVRVNMTKSGSLARLWPDDPHLRIVTGIPRITSTTPLSEVSNTTTWTVDTKSVRGNFTGVGYYFGHKLRELLNVPVGIIWSARGATGIEQWTDRKYTLDLGISYYGEGTSYNYAEYYYSMISPLQPYGIKGAVWYQGETHCNANQYYKALIAFTKCWRTDWGQGTFPFILVQIAPYGSVTGDNGWAEVREADLIASRAIARTSLALTIDVSDPAMIHPTNKEPVGVRVALAAMEDVYHKHHSNKESRKHLTPGPTYRSMSINGNTATITFDNVGSGLTINSGTSLTGWIIAGPDKVWHNATAEIRGNTVAVWSSEVTRPVAVRFGWWDAPAVNLCSVEGFPAAPFRTDCPIQN
ncbi:MAG: sialate O-acetylesterase [Armatimonadota bacterium]|nr:hypothetical protein [bacterium]